MVESEFYKEIAFLRNLEHPGIVKFICFYFENEKVSGLSFHMYLNPSNLSTIRKSRN